MGWRSREECKKTKATRERGPSWFCSLLRLVVVRHLFGPRVRRIARLSQAPALTAVFLLLSAWRERQTRYNRGRTQRRADYTEFIEFKGGRERSWTLLR